MASQSVGTDSARQQPAEIRARQRRRTPVRVAGTRAWAPWNIAGGSAIPWVRPVAGAAASPPGLAPLPATASPRSRTIIGAVAWIARASRRDTSVREGAAGWTGGDTVRPVRTSEPLRRGASAGSSRTRVGVSVRLTTRPGAGSADAVTMRRRVGTAGRAGALASADRPGPSGTARIGRLAPARGRTSGPRARGSIGRLPRVGALRTNPVPAPAFPSRGITAVADDPRIESAIVLVGAAAGASWGRPRWWTRPWPMQGEKNGSHDARGSNTFCWNPMKVQSVQVGYIGYWTPVSCCIA